ncbi:hypothetical protein JCM8208_007816 [Rhodotorula glutinis]
MPPWPDTYPLSFFAPLAPSLPAAATSPPVPATSTRPTSSSSVRTPLPAPSASHDVDPSTAPPPAVPPAACLPPPPPRHHPPPSAPCRPTSAPHDQPSVASPTFDESAAEPLRHLAAVDKASSSSSAAAPRRSVQPAIGTGWEPVRRGSGEREKYVERNEGERDSRWVRRPSERDDDSDRWAPTTTLRSSHLYDDDLGPSTFAASNLYESDEPGYASPRASNDERRRSPRRRTRSPSPPARLDSRPEPVEPRYGSLRSMPPAFIDRPRSARLDRAPEPVPTPSASSSRNRPLRPLDDNVDEDLREAKRPRLEHGAATSRTSPPASLPRRPAVPPNDASAPLRDSSRALSGKMSLSDRWDALEEGRAAEPDGGRQGGSRRSRRGRRNRRKSAAAVPGEAITAPPPSSQMPVQASGAMARPDCAGLVFDFAAEPPRRRSSPSPPAEARPSQSSRRNPSPRTERRGADRDRADDDRARSSTGRRAPAPPPARTLRDSDLSPSIGSLKQRDFKPLVLDRPVEPTWSLALFRLILKLLISIASPELWAPNAAALAAGTPHVEPGWLESSVLALQPDKHEVRAACGGSPGRSFGFASLSGTVYERYLAMVDVVRWLFDDRSLGESGTAYVMLHAPREVRLLISHFADVVLFSELVQRHERALVAYLTRLPAPSPRQRASLTLLEWLNTTAHPDRHYLFLSEPDGRLRGEKTGVEPWRWWVARAEGARSTAVEVLDEWERDTLAMEQW